MVSFSPFRLLGKTFRAGKKLVRRVGRKTLRVAKKGMNAVKRVVGLKRKGRKSRKSRGRKDRK
jgi:hypothetical protein